MLCPVYSLLLVSICSPCRASPPPFPPWPVCVPTTYTSMTPDQHHPLCLCAGYLSAICHDLDHKGLNNDFLIRTNSPLAIQYNDLSPLENHHLAQSFRLLNRDDCSLLRHLSKDRQVSAVCFLFWAD